MFIPVIRSSLPPFEEYVDEIRSIWESKWLTNMGEKHHALERQLKDYLGVPSISLFTNGHTALEMALQALQLTGEVITSPFTFASTTHAITRSGLTPVFCDIRPDDYTLDTEKIESLITEKTSAIVAVHVYGNVCDVKGIDRLAKKYGLKVIYDAAHAFGVTVHGKGIGCFGDFSMFSFHATKVFNTIEGGALAFSNETHKTLLDQIKNFGIISPEQVVLPGGNGKMNEFAAAMGICNLRHIEQNILRRKSIVNHYRERLMGTNGLTLLQVQEGVSSNYAYFPVVFDEKRFWNSRDGVHAELAKNNITSRKYFYPLTSDYKCYRDKYDSSQTPVAKYVAERVLALPLFPELTIADVDQICRILLPL